MSSSKKLTGDYLSEAQNTPPPLHTVNVYTVYLFKQGKGGGELTKEKL
jgi:hypothetical protein